MDKACYYGNDLFEPDEIAEYVVGGVYGEGWEYDPDHDICPDPLNVIREKKGQCADYANLLTYLYKALGMEANSVIIFNGKTIGFDNRLLRWRYSPNPNAWPCLMSEELKACDGEEKEWRFLYHSASYCQSHICDAALGEFRTLDDYEGYWKYYLHPKPIQLSPPHPPSYFSHQEPPPFAPTYYHWNEFVPASEAVLPSHFLYWGEFSHP